MKTAKYAIAALAILATVSCNLNHERKDPGTPYEVETPDYNMDNRADNPSQADSIDRYNSLTVGNMEEMYQFLDMDSSQIRKFEDEYGKKIKRLRDDNDQVIFSHDSLYKEKDESLEKILSSQQYQKYIQWKKDHPNNS